MKRKVWIATCMLEHELVVKQSIQIPQRLLEQDLAQLCFRLG